MSRARLALALVGAAVSSPRSSCWRWARRGKVARTSPPHPPACPTTLDHSAKLAGLPVDVSPAPETGTANPHTQISFMGVPAINIHGVSVAGERSGPHPGRLARLLAGRRRELRARRSLRGRRACDRPRHDRPPPERQAGDVRFSRRHPLPDRGRTPLPQPAGAARRLPELRHAARSTGADPQRHRRRPRSRGGRHPHQQRPQRRDGTAPSSTPLKAASSGSTSSQAISALRT